VRRHRPGNGKPSSRNSDAGPALPSNRAKKASASFLKKTSINLGRIVGLPENPRHGRESGHDED
jgi:hypothetical protein